MNKDFTSPYSEKALAKINQEVVFMPVYSMFADLMKAVNSSTLSLLESKGRVIDLWGGAINPEHGGHKIL